MTQKDKKNLCATSKLLMVSRSQLSDDTFQAIEGLCLCSGNNGDLYSTHQIEVNFGEMNLTMTPKDISRYAQCGNCGFADAMSDMTPGRFPDIKGFSERVEPGDFVPSSECPKCGALMHPSPLLSRKQSPEDFLFQIRGYDYILVK